METMHGKKAVKPSHEENAKAKDKSLVDEFQHSPSEPLLSRSGDLDSNSYPQVVKEWSKQTNATVAASRATDVIIPDPTPQAASDSFCNICHNFLPILEKDSVPRFLRYFKEDGRGVSWDDMITPETFNLMMVNGSVRCAKAALEGQAPELNGLYANPNCMNQYGYFPLHEASESFCVDMIKLLLDHGALPSVRSAGTEVVENLLPLHVAVENTCMHKYLEDNLIPNVDHLDYPTKVDDNYIYKLIHLLCLPEMRMFLDTTRVLAENTDNLLDEIWNYLRDCKAVQTAIILMAAQKHIRRGCSFKRNCGTKVDGFSTITSRLHQSMAIEMGMFQTEEKLPLWQAKVKLMQSASLLVNIISQAGAAIDAFTRAHSEVSYAEVLDGVSSILKIYGFYPPGEVINIDNLCPYKFSTPNGELSYKNASLATGKITAGVADLPTQGKKGVRKRMPRGGKHQSTWLSFFPYWRSVLASKSRVKVYPGHASSDPKQTWDIEALLECGSSSTDKKVSSPARNQNVGSSETIPRPPGIYQPRKAFGTAAMRFLNADNCPIPNHNVSLLGMIPRPGNYLPKREFGAAALRILKMLRKA